MRWSKDVVAEAAKSPDVTVHYDCCECELCRREFPGEFRECDCCGAVRSVEMLNVLGDSPVANCTDGCR